MNLDHIAEFRRAIAAHGWEPPSEIVPGKYQRFSTNGSASDDAGWCMMFDDCRGGVFGDHRTDLKETWQAHRGESFTPEERKAFAQRVKLESIKRERAEKEKHAKAAALATAILNAAALAGADHPYLLRKHINPEGRLREIDAARLAELAGYAPSARGEPLQGRILLAPMGYAPKHLTTLEFIDESGRKSALAGGKRNGSYWATAPIKPDATIIYAAEGMATAASIATALGGPCVASGSCVNFAHVAKFLRSYAPDAKLVICGDRGNGEQAARDAAQSFGAFLALPDGLRDGTDFNDLMIEQGLDAVREQIESASAPAVMKIESIEPPPSDDAAEQALASIGPQQTPSQPQVARADIYRRDGKGNIIKDAANAALMLGRAHEFGFDTFTGKNLINGRELDDAAVRALMMQVQSFATDGKFPFAGFGLDATWAAALWLCESNTYNSSERWLNSLPPWDGSPRITAFLSDIFGAKSNEYTKAASKYFWLSMVQRMLSPGARADMSLVLIGDQGIGKSQALRIIAGERYDSISFHNIGERDWYSSLHGLIIAEFSEFAGFSKRESADVKAEITKCTDRYRPAYGRAEIDVPRTNIFVGTMNPDGEGFLRDTTGNRRFLPINCRGEVLLDVLAQQREQYFAEALSILRSGDAGEFWLIPDAAAMQEEHRERHPWVDVLEEKIEAEIVLIETQSIMATILGIPTERRGTKESRQLAACMAQVGWARALWKADGKSKRGYVRIDSREFRDAKLLDTGEVFVAAERHG